jgi:signal transduction histidine kinase
MGLSLKSIFNSMRYFVMMAVLVFIWSMLIMVYFDRFVQPFDRLKPIITPWIEPETIPAEATVEDRLSMLQEQLDQSNRVTQYSFLTLIGSFSLFCVYLTMVYQQRQRRSRENKLLLLKNQEIARRNEFIRYISATIGHEFKNNLGRIKRRIDLIPDFPKEALARIDDNFSKLFADIEIFKKISDEREAGLIDFKRINLREMLSKFAEHYSDLAEINFKDSMDMTVPSIFASETLLKTVFENLIDNSIKYKKPEQAKARICLACSMDIDSKRRYVSLSFKDEGIGMNEIEADHCFYKRKSTQDGWGQGLYFVKYVIGLHAGKIRVGREYTASGRGTEIIISLPFVEEEINV